MKLQSAFFSLPALALGVVLFAGCESTTNSGYTTTYDQYGRPVYTTNNTGNGQAVDQYGRPVDQYGRPAYAAGVNSYGQPVDTYGRPVATQPVYTDDYVYYPDYEVYYSPTHRDYVYWDGGRWTHHRNPPRSWNRNSVSVHLNFSSGDPWMQHDNIRRQYPRNWRDRRDWDRR
jgi:hypothetical protein